MTEINENVLIKSSVFAGTGSNAAFVEYTKNIEKWDSCYKDDDDSDLVNSIALPINQLT